MLKFENVIQNFDHFHSVNGHQNLTSSFWAKNRQETDKRVNMSKSAYFSRLNVNTFAQNNIHRFLLCYITESKVIRLRAS